MTCDNNCCCGSDKSENLMVGLLMGSDSDWQTMSRCSETLDSLGIAHEVRIISAHRTPEVAAEYSANAESRGLKVIICAAGLAAHLAGAMAAGTALPIIGVPMDAGSLGGLDALLSTVQMPPGVPVATVAIGKPGATNAAVLAAQIIATADKTVAEAVKTFRKNQTAKVAAKDAEFKAK